MTEEKSIDELKAELEKLQKENLEREIEAEKLKVEEARKEKELAEKEKLKEEVRLEVLKEMEVSSTINREDSPQTLENANGKWENFKADFTKVHGLEGLSYDQLCKKAYMESLRR
jgi:hypothetical protein